MKIGWLSVPVAALTGYGRMSREIVTRLMERNELVVLANDGEIPSWGNGKESSIGGGKSVRSLWIPNPQSSPDRAVAAVNSYCGTQHLDIIIAHWDIFALAPGSLKNISVPVLAYIPVDSEMTARWAQFCEGARKLVLFSEFGQVQASRFFPSAQLDYIPHGVDCSTFKPLTKDKADLREEIAPAHTGTIGKDAFLVACTAANVGPRKNLPLLLRTFKRFSTEHPDVEMYLHTNMLGEGYNLPSIIADLGLKEKVHYPKLNPILHPASDEHFAKLYNAADLYVSNSSAEGFGLPLIESQACGLPAVAPDNSSQRELVKGHGFLVDCFNPEEYVDYPSYVPTSNFYRVPNQISLLFQMERAYEAFRKGTDSSYRKAARDFALGYDWRVVMPRWWRLLREMDDELAMTAELKSVLKVLG